MRRWTLVAAGLVALVVPFAGCGEPVDTPSARIALFARCHVPSGAIQAEDRIEGAEHAETWARVLLPREKVDAFVESCGYHPPLDEDYRDDIFTARHDPWWWDAQPGDVLTSGATFVDWNFTSKLLIVPRDTDVAVYVHTQTR